MVAGYLSKMKHTVIRFRTGLPDYSDIPHIKHDWDHSVCSEVTEELPKDTLETLRRPVILTHYVGTNLYNMNPDFYQSNTDRMVVQET